MASPDASEANQIFRRIAPYGNGLLILSVAAVLALLILPVPPLLLDFFLAVNIAGSLTLLVVSVSIPHSMRLSVFPTLLLVSTLFRLGLNIASSRLILTDGFAGHIIETFGNFAIGGNLAVGLILFLIITIIQFIVIAKGSERVAEVAARFTLDALPGKQMSIDADLRAGMLTQEEARAQRHNLHQESRMYGAMDGAMKFVKGDAIAGMVVIAVNIMGGLFTGVFQRGLSFTDAGRIYTLLTIGDGLVSQIPALLVSLTAGFVITRVADDKSENSLGTDIGFQILSQPKALLTAAALSVGVGFIPGFPFLLFLLVGLSLAGASVFVIHAVNRRANAPTPVESYVVGSPFAPGDKAGMANPLVLEVGPELYRIFRDDPRWTHCLGSLYPKLRAHLSVQLGVPFPELKLSVTEALSQSFRYQIKLYDVPADSGILNPKHCALIGESPAVPNLDSEPGNTTETVHGTKITLWDLSKLKTLKASGLNTYTPEEMLLRYLAKILKRHAGEFLGIQETRLILSQAEAAYPELVREVIPKMMSLQKLTEILKRLVEEGVPIKDLRLILQTLSWAQPETKDPVTLTEQARIGLRRTITYQYARDGRLPALTVDPVIEDEIRGAIQRSGSECYLALNPESLSRIADAFRDTLSRISANPAHCVVLTHIDVRRYLRKILEEELPELAVLSFQELDPKVLIQPLGTVSHDADRTLFAVNS